MSLDRTEDRASSTSERLFRAAAELFLAKGYDGTSIALLADKVGITKASLYHYIDTKEDLLYKVLLQAHISGEETLNVVRAATSDYEALQRFIYMSASKNAVHAPHALLFGREFERLTVKHQEEIRLRRRQYTRALREIVANLQECGTIMEAVPASVLASMILGATNSVSSWYVGMPDPRPTPEDVGNLYVAVLTHGILKGSTS